MRKKFRVVRVFCFCDGSAPKRSGCQLPQSVQLSFSRFVVSSVTLCGVISAVSAARGMYTSAGTLWEEGSARERISDAKLGNVEASDEVSFTLSALRKYWSTGLMLIRSASSGHATNNKSIGALWAGGKPTVTIAINKATRNINVAPMVASRLLKERLTDFASTPAGNASLASKALTTLSRNPHREQNRCSSDACSWLHLGQNIALRGNNRRS